MALLELAQSDLPMLGCWKAIKRLENYWKFPVLHNITFLSSCSHAHLVWSLPAKELLSGQGFLIGLPSSLSAGTLAWVFCPVMGCFIVLSGTFLWQRVWILHSTAIPPCHLKILQVPRSFLPGWLSFSLRALLTAPCPLLMLIMLLGLSPSLYLGGVLLYSFLFAKNVHKSFFSQHLQEAEENGHLYCPAFACSASVWAVF